MTLKTLLFRPTMGQGGADRMTATLLQSLDRQRFDLGLVLVKESGEFIEDVPDDVPIHLLNVSSLWTAWFPLKKLLLAHQPDVFFSTSGGANIPAVIAYKLAGQRGRLILSERNTVYHGELNAKRRLVLSLKKVLYQQADQITAVSEGVKQDMVEKLGLSPDRIQVVYNPVVTDEIIKQAEEPLGHPWFQRGQPPVILAAGRMVKQKDFATLICAFAQVRRLVPIRLVILGEGPLQGELETLAHTLGVGEDVCFPGFDKNPFRYMAACSLFVLSSLHEGLPGVLIQAMACGAPVISTDCPYGPSEIITADGEDGFLVPVGDVAAVADRIHFLLDNPEVRKNMAAKGRLSAERFRAEAILARYTAAIEGTI